MYFKLSLIYAYMKCQCLMVNLSSWVHWHCVEDVTCPIPSLPAPRADPPFVVATWSASTTF